MPPMARVVTGVLEAGAEGQFTTGLGDDIDDAAHSLGAIEGTGGTFDDFNFFYITEIDAIKRHGVAEPRRVCFIGNAATIDHDQRFICIHTTDDYIMTATAGAALLENIRIVLKYHAQIMGAAGLDVLGRDDLCRCRHILHFILCPRGCDDHGIQAVHRQLLCGCGAAYQSCQHGGSQDLFDFISFSHIFTPLVKKYSLWQIFFPVP